MISNISAIQALIDEIGHECTVPLNIYMIGGGALMFLRAKDVTKDIDLIVKSEQDYNTLTTTLMNLGFESTRPTPGMERANISDTLVRDDVRIDLFEKNGMWLPSTIKKYGNTL